MSNWSKPPTYEKLGKTQADFFKKKFQTNKAIKFVSKADGGAVKFETEIQAAKNNTLAGSFKVVNDLDLPGSAEVELDTAGSFKGTFKHDKVADGAKLKIVATEKQNVEATIDYAHGKSANATITVDASQAATIAKAAAVVGYDGLSVGVSLEHNLTDLTDYNAGTEYQGRDFTAAVKTQSKADEITASYLHDLNPDVQLASRFAYSLKTGVASRKLEVGAHFKIDKASYFRIKGDSNGNIENVFSQSFSNPNVSYSLGFKFDANSRSTAPTGWGFGFTFGDDN